MSEFEFDDVIKIAHKIVSLENVQEQLTELRIIMRDCLDLARTGCAPDAFGMTPAEWSEYKVNKIAGKLARALGEK